MTQYPLLHLDPRILKPNPWNPNVVDPANRAKIRRSIEQEGFFRPLLVRELEDGTYEIIGGEHRCEIVIELGMATIPVVNLGRIDDAKAKRLTLLDNARYGQDDADRMAQLFADDGMGSLQELLQVLPMEDAEISAYLNRNLDDFEDLDAEIAAELGDDEIDLSAPDKPSKTHQVLRFKVALADAELVLNRINEIRRVQGFSGSDDLTNCGDALVWLIQQTP